MRTEGLALIALLFVSSACASSAAFAASDETLLHNELQAARMSKEEKEVWRVIEDWNAAFAANDVDRYFRFIDKDVTVLTPSNPYRVEGLPDDRSEFVFGLKAGYSRVALFQEIAPIVRVFGDVAYVNYFNRGYYGPEGEGELAYLKETDILRKTAEGWKIIHIHVSK